MPWLALQLEIAAPHTEALSEALLELGADSVTIEDAQAATPEESPLYAEPATEAPRVWLRNRVSVLVAPQTDAAALIAAAAHAAGLRPPPAYRVAPVEDEDWVRRTQSQFTPLRAGERLWIVPSWCAPPDVHDAIILRLDPGLAFGTGSHPTTQLVLAWLERALGGNARAGRTCRPLRVLDYGCGSGILALAAAKLGASEVVAVDLDPQALDACAANARANGVSIRIAPPDALPAGDYDLIAANILAEPLIRLAPLFAARSQRGTRIALSGVLAAQGAQVMAAYAQAFDLCVERASEDWVLLAGERR